LQQKDFFLGDFAVDCFDRWSICACDHLCHFVGGSTVNSPNRYGVSDGRKRPKAFVVFDFDVLNLKGSPKLQAIV
jgi:hypothetical protein